VKGKDTGSLQAETDWIGDRLAEEILIFGAKLGLDKMGEILGGLVRSRGSRNDLGTPICYNPDTY
jgi:hypothetical protein